MRRKDLEERGRKGGHGEEGPCVSRRTYRGVKMEGSRERKEIKRNGKFIRLI